MRTLRDALVKHPDFCSVALGLGIRVGHDADDVDSKCRSALEVTRHLDPVIAAKSPILHTAVFGDELHQDGDPRNKIDRIVAQHRRVALQAGHSHLGFSNCGIHPRS